MGFKEDVNEAMKPSHLKQKRKPSFLIKLYEVHNDRRNDE